jgi:hypothetical protein
LVPAHVPSVDTFLVPVGAGAVVVVPEVPHVPKPDWQPVPQYAEVEPHQPAEEQQLPKVLPWQVKPLVPPQVASVETFLVGAEVAAVVLIERLC